jgi:DNA-directed RNA polymerase subunit RPC12/RpoP
MTTFLGAASRGAVVAVRCPKCGEVQARARGPAGTRYVCRACGKRFTLEEAKVEEPPRAASQSRAKRRKK